MDRPRRDPLSDQRISITITFPPLTTQQAIALWEALTKAADEIWVVHGDTMGEVFAQEDLGAQDDDFPLIDPAHPDDELPF
jgi:hypothetical protein